MINDLMLTSSTPAARIHNEQATHQLHAKGISKEREIKSLPQPSKTSGQDPTLSNPRLRTKLTIWTVSKFQDGSYVGVFEPGH